jgi:hypothetical protein
MTPRRPFLLLCLLSPSPRPTRSGQLGRVYPTVPLSSSRPGRWGLFCTAGGVFAPLPHAVLSRGRVRGVALALGNATLTR